MRNIGPDAAWTVSGRVLKENGSTEHGPTLPFAIQWEEAQRGESHLFLKTNALGTIQFARSISTPKSKWRYFTVAGLGQFQWHREKHEPPILEIELTFLTDRVEDDPIVVAYEISDTAKDGITIRPLAP